MREANSRESAALSTVITRGTVLSDVQMAWSSGAWCSLRPTAEAFSRMPPRTQRHLAWLSPNISRESGDEPCSAQGCEERFQFRSVCGLEGVRVVGAWRLALLRIARRFVMFTSV